jgi:iron complex outermembrane recepter protein
MPTRETTISPHCSFCFTIKTAFMNRIYLLCALFLGMAHFTFAQFELSGKVTNESGEPLTGAAVKINNASMATNAKGEFSFANVDKSEQTINVTFIGFEPYQSKIFVDKDSQLTIILKEKSFYAKEVVVSANKANNRTPIAFTDMDKRAIEAQNTGKDLPMLISLQPSVVVTSDAGNGVGYTGFRIRGTDANRINVTVNGIPLNDAESHGVYWVNMPDFASSLENLQIQRGVGTSTNGAAAFGASINLQSNGLNAQPYAEVATSAGSFNTSKQTVKVGSGLLNERFTFDARLSRITSDGFIDRAESNLKSYYLSGGYFTDNTTIRANVFSGTEKTYQAWWGVPKVRLQNDTEGMQRYADHYLYTSAETQHMINSNNRTYNYYTYDNETDNYQQDHYQLFLSQKLADALHFNAALHYTYGRGYYEQFKANDDLADYGLVEPIIGDDTIKASNLVRQKWLDNHFYGTVLSLVYQNQLFDATLGTGLNQYVGDHFGKVIWGQYIGDNAKDFEWYRGDGVKTDFNVYAKLNAFSADKRFNAFADVQYRYIDQQINGIDDDLRDISQQHRFNFFNPKLGMMFAPTPESQFYASFGISNREPNRSNFTDKAPNDPMPQSERLYNLEVGLKKQFNWISVGANIYAMEYDNQLVMTGKLNDVGTPIMTNVKESYRRGIELMAGIIPSSTIEWNVNATFSNNKIENFSEFVDDWDNWAVIENNLGKTDIGFSPNIIAGSQLTYKPFNKFGATWTSQYVGRQYIDNTSSSDRQLDAYWVNNLIFNYSIAPKAMKYINLSLEVNNLFSEVYETNAWVYSYYYEGQRWAQDGYFPMAGRNFMVGVTFGF